MRFAYDKPSMRTFDVDGRLHVSRCRISKANVCGYLGREIPNWEGLGLDPNYVYKLYRDPAELEKAASTFSNLQLMIVHIPVDANEPQIELTVGTVGTVSFVHPYLVADVLTVWTAEAIQLIKSGQQAQLSSSYRYRADMQPGTTPEGVAFDGVMRDIMGNHVALVEQGRAGPDVIVNDSIEVLSMKFPKLVAALKSMLKPDADLVAVDSAVAGVMADDKPRSTAFLRIATAIKPFIKGEAADFSALASDAAVESELAAAEDAEEETEEEKKKRLAAEDADAPTGERVKPGPTTGEVGAALDAALKSGKFVTAEDAKAMQDAATIDAVARINALHNAREAVKPIVGNVAMDSAEAVYRFALDKAGIAHKDVHASALPALVDLAKQRNATPAAPVTVALDADASAGLGLGRFGKA